MIQPRVLRSFVVFCVLISGASIALGNVKREAAIPIGANWSVPERLITDYYGAVRIAENKIDRVSTDTTYANVVSMLRGTVVTGGSTPSTEDVLKPYVHETQEIHYLDENLAIRAGYLTAGTSFGKSVVYIVERWSKFVNIKISSPGESPNPIEAKVGFCISLVTRATSEDASLSLDGIIKSFTLGASRSKLSLTSHTEVMGLSGKSITSNLPSASDFLQAQAEATETAIRNKESIPLARNRAFLEVAAGFFSSLRGQVWNAEFVQPVIIAIDKDDLEQLR